MDDPVSFYGSGMYRKHPNHTYGRNLKTSPSNRANVLFTYAECIAQHANKRGPDR